MKKILVSIANNNLTFSYKKVGDRISSNLLNTNIISDNELVFTDEYIRENIKIVSTFIKELILQYNINQVNISNMEMTLDVINILKYIDTINSMAITDEKTITYEICEKLIELKKITSLSCYNIPAFMLELLDKHNIKVISRGEILFTSNFMEGNNLSQFSKIYYKSSIRIELPISKEDAIDFQTFFKINKYLKTIHVNIYSKDGIEFIIYILKKYKRKNIKILLHDNITKQSQAEFLKRLNKANTRYKINIKLVYDENYVEKNILKQIMMNTLKICGFIIACLVVSAVSYVLINNYESLKEVNKIKDDLEKVIETTDTTKMVEELEENGQKEIKNPYLASLSTVNPDTVGWLTVNNTNVDYPVVKSEDNKHYLDYNFNNEEDHDGWVFMDYRNNPEELDKNTIIYGHNRYYSGVMFGTLYKTAYKSWYGVEENQTIKFDSLYENMEWQIFSIYKIEKTTDYMKVNFSSNEVWMEFIDMLKNRSVYDFGVNVGENDYILTLSTCSSNRNTRLVIHAVLKSNE